MLQLRQLLLDPAVAKEFQRLKAELEGKAKEVKSLQEELQAVQFSQESKAGRMLMAKCRALQVCLFPARYLPNPCRFAQCEKRLPCVTSELGTCKPRAAGNERKGCQRKYGETCAVWSR